MRGVFRAACLATLLLAGPAGAQERPDGYAFEQPRLLTQQLIWGLVHGVRVLANRCQQMDGPDSQAIGLAYADWLDRYHERIASAAADLSRFYFHGGDDLSYEALTAALHLKSRVVLRDDELALACGSFLDALASPRYDLDLFYRLHRDAARVERAETIRKRVAGCLKQLDREQAADLEQAMAGWQQANALLESVALSELLERKGDQAEDRRWRQEAGAGAAPPTVACPALAASLSKPGFALGNIFEESHE